MVERGAESSLSEPELLRRVVDATRLLIVVVDADGNVARVNRAVESLTGLPQAALRRPIWELAALPVERALLQLNFGSTASGRGVPSELMFHLSTAGGAAPAIDWAVDVDRQDGQAPFVLTGLNISERFAARESLRESEDLKRLILDRLPGRGLDDRRQPAVHLGGRARPPGHRPRQ